MMSVGTILFLGFVLLNDLLVIKWMQYKIFNRSPALPSLNTSMDDDVRNEMERVSNKTRLEVQDSNLVLNGLTKFYGKFNAVNQVYVGVEKAECFGLLGINGSGKTSIFKMLTGDEIISAGNAWIHGLSVKTDVSNVYKQIGYCPQFDAVLPDLSGRETLKLICLLRGISRNEIDDVIKSFAKELHFTKYLDVKVNDFSGGNKRKLSTALSLIGDLSLVFLDECSSGIDPKAKRKLWNMITKTRIAGKSVILTSHSMQECEQLCTKLAIMVDGEFKCLGSIQHIKNKFSKGFVLKIMMSHRDDESHFHEIQTKIQSTFPNAELKERFMGLLTFHINTSDLKWSQVFAELSTMRDSLGISDYTMSQSSLESVFLFVSKQGKRKVD
jgi:ATP-binding cassette subfamily A (ABC1) protein 3